MVRNAEASRGRILDAALAEFSGHGVAGARVDRIAAAAGCNKNLIYIYFESKERLFNTVLERNLSRVYEDVTFTPGDLGGYAGRVFDFAMAHPDLLRLMAWSNLEQPLRTPSVRQGAAAAKVDAMREAQQHGDLGASFSPEFLLTAVMALATAWTPASPFGSSLDPRGAEKAADLRSSITEAIDLITRVHPPSG